MVRAVNVFEPIHVLKTIDMKEYENDVIFEFPYNSEEYKKRIFFLIFVSCVGM